MSNTIPGGDYTGATLRFQISKAFRYARLYGLAHTVVKIKGQLHMKATADFEGNRWLNPKCITPEISNRDVAIIGCGNYAFSNIAYYLSKINSRFLRCTYSPGRKSALSLCKAYKGAYATSDWRDILTDERVRIVFVASDDNSHAEYAIACIEAGKHVHIEKPHVVTQDQLVRLLAAMERHPDCKVFLGFNRPRSPLVSQLEQLIERESGPLMINWAIAIHAAREVGRTGAKLKTEAVLSHLCHWCDLTLHLIKVENAFPCTIIPAVSDRTSADIIVAIIFANGSSAAITFSSKGHSFEGLREVLNLHKGNLLATLSDFQTLKVEVLSMRKTINLPYRDHGHQPNIVHSYVAAIDSELVGSARSYVSATAKLFLAVSEAVGSGETLTIANDGTVAQKVR